MAQLRMSLHKLLLLLLLHSAAIDAVHLCPLQGPTWPAPTGLENPGQLSFRAVIPPPLSSGIGPFSSSCISWVTVDAQVYGNVGIDEFVFHLDRKGNAVSVSPRVLGAVLLKTK